MNDDANVYNVFISSSLLNLNNCADHPCKRKYKKIYIHISVYIVVCWQYAKMK